MKNICLEIAFSLCLISFYANNAAAENISVHQTLVLSVGETQRLPVVAHSNIYIQNRILKAKVQNTDLVLTAEKHGQTQVRIDHKSYFITVMKKEDQETVGFLFNSFKDHPTLQLKFDYDGLNINGTLLSESDLETLIYWAKNYKLSHPVQLKVSFPDFLKPVFEQIFSSELQQSVFLTDTNLRQLKLTSKPSASSIAILKSLNLKHHVDEVSEKPMGNLKIYFAEIKKNKLEQLSPIFLSSHPLNPLNLDSLLTPEFNHSEDQVFSSIGSQTQILLFDQQEAKVHSGGEFPILNQSFHRSDVSWKQFGLFLDVTGKDLSPHNSILDLNFKLSMVVSSNNENGIPSLTSDSWKQKVRIKKNKTYILKSGFTKHHLQNFQNSTLFKKIPLLNFLFQGRSKNKGDTDLVLVLSLNTSEI